MIVEKINYVKHKPDQVYCITWSYWARPNDPPARLTPVNSQTPIKLIKQLAHSTVPCQHYLQRAEVTNLGEGAWSAPFRAEHDIVPGLVPEVIPKLGRLI